MFQQFLWEGGQRDVEEWTVASAHLDHTVFNAQDHRVTAKVTRNQEDSDYAWFMGLETNFSGLNEVNNFLTEYFFWSFNIFFH